MRLKAKNKDLILRSFRLGLYQCSPKGDVFSCMGSQGLPRRVPLKMKTSMLGGYKRLCISTPGVRISAFVHSLVYLFFHEDLAADMEVNHIDGNKLNNRIDNLEAVTSQQNVLHSFTLGREPLRGEDHPRRKLCNDSVYKIRELSLQGVSCKKIAALIGVNPSTVSRALRGESWAHLS